MKQSICEDCVHVHVCKYKKEVQEYESKAPAISNVVGPVISYSINCQYKNTGNDYAEDKEATWKTRNDYSMRSTRTM